MKAPAQQEHRIDSVVAALFHSYGGHQAEQRPCVAHRSAGDQLELAAIQAARLITLVIEQLHHQTGCLIPFK